MNINAQRSGALHSQRRARPEDVRLPPPSVTLCCPSCPGPCLAQRWEAGAAAPLWGASSGAPQLWARRARTTAAAKPPRAPSSPPPPAAEQEEDDDIVLIDEGEGEDLDIDEDVYEDGEGEEDDEAGDAGAAVLGLEADDAQPGVETGGVSWAESALQAANKVLALPALSNLELYVFRALPGGKLDIRLDRLDDTYGSPTIDDIEKFSRMFFLELEALVGAEAAGDVALEVCIIVYASSLKQLFKDLERFAGLPLFVERVDADGKRVSNVLVLDELDVASGSTTWHLADVRANATTKGRGLSKRQREMKIVLPLASITLARVYVDF